MFIFQFEVRKKAVLNNLAECLGPEAMDCIFYKEKNWAEEPYNGGCPVSTVMPGAMTCFASGLREPFQR
jgi:monoamine oxidase